MPYCFGYGDLFTEIGRYRAFMPFEGDYTNLTLTHSLHRLVPGRFSFSALPRPGFLLLLFRFGRR